MKTRMNPSRPSLLTFIAPRPEPTHDDIAQCARMIWEAAGKPEGRAQEHWLLAEAQLRHWHQPTAPALNAGERIPARPFSRNGSKRSQMDSMVL